MDPETANNQQLITTTPEPISNQPIVNPVPSVPPPPQPKSKLPLILGIIVLLGMVGVLGILGGKYLFGGKTETAPPVVTVTTTTPTPTVDPTAEWKIYTDPTNTFSLKYPSQFNETKVETGAPKIKGWEFAGYISTSKDTNPLAIDESGMSFTFMILDRKKGEEMKSFVNRIVNESSGEFSPGDVSSEFKNYVIVDKEQALWYEGSLGPAVIHTEIFIPHNDNSVVSIEIWSGEATITNKPYNQTQKVLIDQILSTFKFLP